MLIDIPFISLLPCQKAFATTEDAMPTFSLENRIIIHILAYMYDRKLSWNLGNGTIMKQSQPR